MHHHYTIIHHLFLVNPDYCFLKEEKKGGRQRLSYLFSFLDSAVIAGTHLPDCTHAAG